MHDDHTRPRLQDLQRGGFRRGAHQTLHHPRQPAPPGLALLEERLVRPALRAGREIVQRHDRRSRRAPPVDEQAAALRQHTTGDDLRQVEAPGVEDDRAGHRIKDEQQARTLRFHEERPIDHFHAVGRQAAELGLLPRHLAALDIDGGEPGVGRDQERARRRDLLPADVPLQLERPHRGRAGRSGRNGPSRARRADRGEKQEQLERATSKHGGHGDPPVDDVVTAAVERKGPGLTLSLPKTCWTAYASGGPGVHAPNRVNEESRRRRPIPHQPNVVRSHDPW